MKRRGRPPRHGLTKSPEWWSWHGMWSRALYSKKECYSAVTVSVAWIHFEAFLADMGTRPPDTTLDRIDGTRGYSKENCRWATYSEQNRNRRRYRKKSK